MSWSKNTTGYKSGHRARRLKAEQIAFQIADTLIRHGADRQEKHNGPGPWHRLRSDDAPHRGT